MTRTAWILILALCLALAGCTTDEPDPDCPPGDPGCPPDDPEPTDEPEPEPTNDPEPEPEPRAPVTWNVSISGSAFSPAELTIQKGDTVRWVHDDGVIPHTVTADDGSFDSGSCPGTTCMNAVNDEFEHTFSDAGEWDYHCELHANMVGMVTVLEVYEGVPEA